MGPDAITHACQCSWTVGSTATKIIDICGEGMWFARQKMQRMGERHTPYEVIPRDSSASDRAIMRYHRTERGRGARYGFEVSSGTKR